MIRHLQPDRLRCTGWMNAEPVPGKSSKFRKAARAPACEVASVSIGRVGRVLRGMEIHVGPCRIIERRTGPTKPAVAPGRVAGRKLPRTGEGGERISQPDFERGIARGRWLRRGDEAGQDEQERQEWTRSSHRLKGTRDIAPQHRKRHAALGCVPFGIAGRLGFRLFGAHRDLDVRADLAMQLHGNVELAQLLERLIELHLAAVDGIALLLQRVRDIR